MRDWLIIRMQIMRELINRDGFNGLTGVMVIVDKSFVDSVQKRSLIGDELVHSALVKKVEINNDKIIIDFNKLSSTELNNYYMSFSHLRDKPYPDDYVFDEDKSVRWNREEVQRINQLIRDIKLTEREFINLLHREITKVDMENAREEFNLDDKIPYAALGMIWNRAYEEYHSSGYSDVKNGFRDYLDMCLEFVKLCQ